MNPHWSASSGLLTLAAFGITGNAWAQRAPEVPAAAASAAAPSARTPSATVGGSAGRGSPVAPAATASAPPGTPAGPSATPPQRVEITGGRSTDEEQRRRSTAAKIIVGREELDKYGDATVGEVLRRLPGVTSGGPPGRGGAPRMRGLGSGYTQMLIDGQRVPPGFSFESLTPEQIERIEILRAPTAETGARAIAGTINIITREGYRRRLNDLRIGLSVENGQLTPGIFWTHNDTAGALTYNLSGAIFRPWRESRSRTDTVETDLANGNALRETSESAHSIDHRRGLHANARLQWRLNEQGDQLLLMPSLFHNAGHTQREAVLLQRLPIPDSSRPETLPEYDRASTGSSSRSTSARTNLQWRQRLGPSRVEVTGGIGQFEASSNSRRESFLGGARWHLTEDESQTRDRFGQINAKISTLLGGQAPGSGEHSLVIGFEAEATQRDETRHTTLDGRPLLTDFGDNLSASSLRLAAYAQDEWALNPNWAVHAGLRAESIVTRGEAESGSRPENRSSVWTPLVHVLWKPDPAKRDQIRLSLTRSYRAPSLATLIARPSLNTRDPVPGSNTPTTADSAGNPALKPELAAGLDLAFERYLEGGGVLSANVFHRRVQDLMRRVIALEAVSWAPVPRWVARQQNIGDATTSGIELEAKFRLDQALADALPVELRGNLSLFRSRVQSVPGPDNRLDSQPKASANIGADYRFRGLPLTLGGNLNWVPGYRTQLDDGQAVTVSRKRIFDAYALWTFSPTLALRVLASNLGPQDHTSVQVIDAAGLRTQASNTSQTYTNWQARFEFKL